MNDKNKDMEELFSGLGDDNKNLLLIIAKSLEFAQGVQQEPKKVS